MLCSINGKVTRMVPQALAVEYSFVPAPDPSGEWMGWLLRVQAMRVRHDYPYRG